MRVKENEVHYEKIREPHITIYCVAGRVLSCQALTVETEEAVMVSSSANLSLMQLEEDLQSKETLHIQEIQNLKDIYTISSDTLNEEYCVYYLKPKEPLKRMVYSDGSTINEYASRAVLTRTKEDVDGSLAVVMWSEMTYETKQFVDSGWNHTGYRIVKSSALIKSFDERFGRNFGTRCIQVGENLVTNQIERFDSSHRWGDRIVGQTQSYNPGFSGYMACDHLGSIGTDTYIDNSHNGSTYWTFKIEIREGTIPIG